LFKLPLTTAHHSLWIEIAPVKPVSITAVPWSS
jgi:hypothetical protein